MEALVTSAPAPTVVTVAAAAAGGSLHRSKSSSNLLAELVRKLDRYDDDGDCDRDDDRDGEQLRYDDEQRTQHGYFEELDICIVSLAEAPGSTALQIGRQLFDEWSHDFIAFMGMSSANDVAAMYREHMSGRPLVDGCCWPLGGSVSQRWARRERIAFVAVHRSDGRVIGTASIDTHDMTLKCRGCRGPWLANVLVDADYRHVGIGSILVKHVLDYARCAQRARQIHVWTCSSQQESFYRRLGFRRVASRIRHGQHGDVRVMTLEL